MYCSGGNATYPIWSVLGSSDRISTWTSLKPQHIYSNHLANQFWCSDFLTPPTPLIIPHRLPGILESLLEHKNWCSTQARWSKSSLKHSIHFYGIFSKFKNRILQHIVHLKRQIAFLKLTSCDNQALVGCIPIASVAVPLKTEIIKISQSSHNMDSNNYTEISRVYTIFKCPYEKKSGNLSYAPRILLFWRLDHFKNVI